MKKMLILLIIGICAIALRMPEVAGALGMAASQGPADAAVRSAAASAQPQKPMSAAEFVERSKTDPQAYQKYLNSHVKQPIERSQVDKLMNFLARGTYE